MASVSSKSIFNVDCTPQEEEYEDPESPLLHTITRKLIRSIKPSKLNGIFPIDSHFGVPIFDHVSMKEYVDVSLEKTEGVSASIKIRKTYGDSFQDLAKKIATKLTADLTDPVPCGLIFMPCLSAQFNYSESMTNLTRFYMVNTGLSYFEISLPDPTQNREGLRSLLNPKFRSMIDSVNSVGQAKQIVEGLGGGCYIHKASFGGFCQVLTTSDMVQDPSPEEMLRSMELLLVDTFTIVTGEKKTTTGGKLSGLHVSAIGGHYSLQQKLPHKGVEWTESILDNIDLIDFNLYPISKLAKKGSEQEQLLRRAAKMYARRVVQPYEKFFHLGPVGKRPVARKIKVHCDELISECQTRMTEKGMGHASKMVIQFIDEVKEKLESHTTTEPQFRHYLNTKSDEIRCCKKFKPKFFRVDTQRRFYISMAKRLQVLVSSCEDLDAIGTGR